MVEDRGRGCAARESDALDDRLDRRAGVPDLVDDQDTLAMEQRVRGELQECRLVAGLAVVVVERDGGDQDVAVPEQVREHARRHEPAAGDREQDVVVAPDLLGEALDEALERVPGDDVALDEGRLGARGSVSVGFLPRSPTRRSG